MENNIEEAQRLFENGKTFYDNNNYEKAIECYDRASALNPKDANFFYCWGRALSDLAIDMRKRYGKDGRTPRRLITGGLRFMF